MSDYLAELMDVAGDEQFYDDLAGDDLGRAVQRIQVQRAAAKARPLRRLLAPIPGVPAIGGRTLPLPLGTGAFTVGGALTVTTTTQTQKPYKGRRLIGTLTRTGATATGLLTITQFFCGTNPQQAAIGALPFEAFGPTAFDVMLSIDPVQPGVQIVFQVTVSANPTGAGDRIDFSAMLIGETLS